MNFAEIVFQKKSGRQITEIAFFCKVIVHLCIPIYIKNFQLLVGLRKTVFIKVNGPNINLFLSLDFNLCY